MERPDFSKAGGAAWVAKMKAGGGRAKGAAFERLVVKLLRQVFPQARRRAMQARGGAEGADIDMTPGWWVECGHGKRMNAADKWEQASADAIWTPDTPIAITRRNNGPILVTMALEDWVRVISERGVR